MTDTRERLINLELTNSSLLSDWSREQSIDFDYLGRGVRDLLSEFCEHSRFMMYDEFLSRTEQKRLFCRGWRDAMNLSTDIPQVTLGKVWYNLGCFMGRRFNALPNGEKHKLFDQIVEILDYDQGMETYCQCNRCGSDPQRLVSTADDDNTGFYMPTNQFTNNVEPAEILFEGSLKRILMDTYERNPEARRQCIEHYGAKCCACQFDFAQKYGSIMEGMIHVHHHKQLSEIRTKHIVDPIADLIPLCANCHAVIHHKDPCYTLDELIGIINTNSGK